ncbi:MAG: hypothetical protein LV481_03475 [Methylacidiphilales bacterium]|nr:hypothetical protein [Candidatus Methylacidiphilales bacterium]
MIARKTAWIAKCGEKKSFDFSKFHLTRTPGKFNPWLVTKFYFHNFAQKVRSDEGVILHGS